MQIKYGSTRIVFIFKNIVIKIPNVTEWRLFLLGLLGNMQEVKFSKLNSTKICPVMFNLPLGFFLIARKAEPLTREEFFNLDVLKWKIENNFIVPVENKFDSFGKIDGKIVAVDYGD